MEDSSWRAAISISSARRSHLSWHFASWASWPAVSVWVALFAAILSISLLTFLSRFSFLRILSAAASCFPVSLPALSRSLHPTASSSSSSSPRLPGPAVLPCLPAVLLAAGVKGARFDSWGMSSAGPPKTYSRLLWPNRTTSPTLNGACTFGLSLRLLTNEPWVELLSNRKDAPSCRNWSTQWSLELEGWSSTKSEVGSRPKV